MRNVPTFCVADTKCSFTKSPTVSFARAFTRSAWALFQVNPSSSMFPDKCSTNTSFCSFAARFFASS